MRWWFILQPLEAKRAVKLVYDWLWSHPYLRIQVLIVRDWMKERRSWSFAMDFQVGFVIIILLQVLIICGDLLNFQSGSGDRKRKGDPLSFLPTLPAVSITPALLLWSWSLLMYQHSVASQQAIMAERSAVIQIHIPACGRDQKDYRLNHGNRGSSYTEHQCTASTSYTQQKQ